MQLASVIYTGSKVELLVQAWSYDNVSKGIKPSLAGIRIIDATTPRLQISASSIDVASVFGVPGGQQGSGPNAAPVTTQQNVVQPVANPLGVPGAVPAGGAGGNVVTPHVDYTRP